MVDEIEIGQQLSALHIKVDALSEQLQRAADQNVALMQHIVVDQELLAAATLLRAASRSIDVVSSMLSQTTQEEP